MRKTSSRHRTVARIDLVLDTVARRQPSSLSEIAAAVGAPVSSTKDLLDELTAHGYLLRRGRLYHAGPRPRVLSELGGWSRPAGMDHGVLLRLSEAARAPVLLAVLAGGDVVYLDHAGPRAPARMQQVADLHLRRPALRTAAGRLLLATASWDTHEVLGRLREADPTGYESFERELPAIRRHGLARSDGLADPDIRAIAVPAAPGDSAPGNAAPDASAQVALVVTGRRRGARDRSLTLDAAARRLVAAVRADVR